jgi:hypothetical protein
MNHVREPKAYRRCRELSRIEKMNGLRGLIVVIVWRPFARNSVSLFRGHSFLGP